MIDLHKIKIEGFGSIIEPFSYNLNTLGVNLIFGPNGSGKTTVFSALTWVLYGQTLGGKSSEPWDEIKPSGFMGTKVELFFKSNKTKIKVVRCKKYRGKVEGKKGGDKVFLYINGTYQEKYRNKKDVNRAIEKTLGMSFDLFKNSILFGQKLTRLLNEKGQNQKKVFEEAFDIPFISAGRKKALEDLSIYRNLLSDKTNRIDNIKNSIESKKSLIKALNDRTTGQLEELTEQIREKKAYIKSMEKEIPSYNELKKTQQEQYDKLDRLNKKVDKLRSKEQEHFRLDLKIGGVEKDLEFKESEIKEVKRRLASKSKTCYACGQPINKEQVLKQKKADKELLKIKKLQLQGGQEELVKLKTRFNKLDSSIKKLNSLNQSRDKIEISLSQIEELGFGNLIYSPESLKSEKKLLKTLIKKYDDTKVNLGNDENLVKAKKELKSLKKQYKEEIPLKKSLKKKVKVLEWVTTDALSNKGLKNYIFQSQLKSVNKALKTYAKTLGYRVKLAIDLESGNKNFNAYVFQGDSIRDYEDLSGGQQQLVDICLAFAIHDVVFESREVRLLIMDEVFESLDDKNIDIVAELIRVKARESSVHIITHRKEFLSTKINRQISTRLTRSGITEFI